MTALLPPPTALVIDPVKIRSYLLNLNHPVGRSKAIFFINCGFAQSRLDELANCLFAHADPGHLSETLQTAFGTKWVYEGPIHAPKGVYGRVRSVWIDRQNLQSAELCTAYKF